VAVMGALVTTIGRAKINSGLPHVPAATRSALASSLGSGAPLGGHHASAEIVATVKGAFVSALSTGLTIGGVVTLAGAFLAWALIESKPKATQPEPAAAPDDLPADEPAPELTAV